MTEANIRPENDPYIQNLKTEIALLTLNPESINNFDTEYERSAYIDDLKQQLTDYGVDGNEFQARVVTDNMKTRPKAPLDNIVHVDFDIKTG